MSESEIYRRLAQVFASVFDEPIELCAETSADDVAGWDSVRHVELMVAIERAFGLRFTTGEIAAFATVGDVVARLGAATVQPDSASR